MNRILIVDDSQIMRRMVIETLRGLGEVSFEQAASGLEAIEKLAASRFDLMTLDLNMPDMHGLEVLHFIRRQPLREELPIIVLTTKGDDASREAALDAGASWYVAKPFAPGALLQVARNLLKRGESGA